MTAFRWGITLLVLLLPSTYPFIHQTSMTPSTFHLLNNPATSKTNFVALSAHRRDVLLNSLFPAAAAVLTVTQTNIPNANAASARIDVNNAMAREFTAFPGLYPTIATKIVMGAKQAPYKNKAEVYAILDSDLERERLKQYDAAIVISKPNASLRQFKESQICKYECGSRVSSSYRDEQIKAVQADRR